MKSKPFPEATYVVLALLSLPHGSEIGYSWDVGDVCLFGENKGEWIFHFSDFVVVILISSVVYTSNFHPNK